MDEILRINHATFLVPSDSRPGEYHQVEFTLGRAGQAEERCACENWQLGIPHLIAQGKMSDTPEHRRCKHILRVRESITNRVIDDLVKTDPSNETQKTTDQEETAFRWRRRQ